MPGKLSITPDCYSNMHGPVPHRGNALPNAPGNPSELLSAAHRLLAGAQRPTINEVIVQTGLAEPTPVPIGPSYQPAAIAIDQALNLPVANIEEPGNTLPAVLPKPEILPVEPLPITPQVAYTPAYSSQFEYPGEMNVNFPPLGPMPLDPMPQPVPMQEPIYAESLSNYPDFSQYYQPSVTVQIPSMPVITPFIAVATPVPAMLPQSPATNVAPELPENTVNQPITDIASVVEASPVVIPTNIGASIVEQVPSYSPQPFSFQINMPPPSSEQPIILISSPNPVPTSQQYSSTPSLPSMLPPPVIPPPVIVMERSRSSWRNLLPILLIALCDGGCGNGCGNCGCCGGCNIPVPYPIPIPTNNPIILGRGKARGNSTSTATAVPSTKSN